MILSCVDVSAWNVFIAGLNTLFTTHDTKLSSGLSSLPINTTAIIIMQ